MIPHAHFNGATTTAVDKKGKTYYPAVTTATAPNELVVCVGPTRLPPPLDLAGPDHSGHLAEAEAEAEAKSVHGVAAAADGGGGEQAGSELVNQLPVDGLAYM